MHRITKHTYEYEVVLPLSFHDTDAMGVVWHGNYLKYFEIAREGLLFSHNLDYRAMDDSGYIYPVIEEQIRYRKAIMVYDRQIRVKAYLMEVENRVKLGYEVFDGKGELAAFGYTIQVAVNADTREMSLVTP